MLSLALIAAASQNQRPPTIDPTYGFPVPPIKTAVPKPKPDASWIWASGEQKKETVYLRAAFDLKAAPKDAKLYITADNYFTAFVNGSFVGATEPVENDDFVWAKVRKYDVFGLLSKGKNVIAVEAVNGGGPAGVLARLEIDGKPVLYSDRGWRASTKRPEDAWLGSGFADTTWPAATIIGPSTKDTWANRIEGWPEQLSSTPAYLQHLPINAVAYSLNPGAPPVTRWVPAKADQPFVFTSTGSSNVLLVDFGKELTGRVQVTSDRNMGVTIGTGESDGEALEKPWTSTQFDLLRDKTASTPYSAFRYAKITFHKPVAGANLKIVLDHLYYPVEYKGSFDCSDPLLTRIWYIGAYTAHLCMQEDIWDAPKRDRMRWMGDQHVAGEVVNNVFFDSFLMEQTMQRLRETAQAGRPATELPMRHVNSIPGYSCAWVCGLADYYRHVGAKDYLRKNHALLISMLEYFRGELDENGLFANKRKEWPFVDWAPEFNEDKPLARMATHLFLIKSLHEASFLFTELGDEASAKKYDAWAAQLEAAARQHFPKEGLYGDRRQSNAMAVYSGVAAPADYSTIWETILKPGTPAWDIVATPYYNNYVLFAMSQMAHTQEAVDFIRRYWGGMLAQGATSWWEGYDPKWDKNNFHAHLEADNGIGYFVSLSHAWSAGPTNLLTEKVLGIQPTSGGFRTALVEPELGDLTWASGVVPTPGGAIKLRVDKDAAGEKWQLTVPRGTTAHVRLRGPSVEINGKHVVTTVEGGKLSTDLGPGAYTIVSR